MAALGLGLVGCGRFGQILANTAREIGGATIVAVADQSLATARALAVSLGVPAYETYQGLLADPCVEAALVVIPHSLHEEVVTAAARSGKHVFCEKPMAIDVAACYRMLDAVERHSVKLMIGQVWKFYPVYKRAAAIAREGRLGRLAAMNVENLVHIDRLRWWARSETMGALLHSPGVHFIDFLLWVCGPARSVYAVESAVRVQPAIDYQDSVFLTIEFESGAIGSLQCSVSCLTPASRGQIIGSQGSLTFDPLGCWVEVASWNGERERIDLTSTGDPNAHQRIAVSTELRSFVDWVSGGAEPIMTARDGLRAVEVIDAAYLSIARREPIALPLPRAGTS